MAEDDVRHPSALYELSNFSTGSNNTNRPTEPVVPPVFSAGLASSPVV